MNGALFFPKMIKNKKALNQKQPCFDLAPLLYVFDFLKTL
jgi:hypothetical protein